MSLANQFSAIHWYNRKISEAECQRDAYEKLSKMPEEEIEMVELSQEDQAIFLYQKHGGNGFTDYLADLRKNRATLLQNLQRPNS